MYIYNLIKNFPSDGNDCSIHHSNITNNLTAIKIKKILESSFKGQGKMRAIQ